MRDKSAVLKQYFGYDHFRQGQGPLIDSILAGQDTLGIMPTGAGKSICFQIPALMFQGVTLVISPLISLMKDQVNTLVQIGVRAAYLNSSLTINQYSGVLQKIRENAYQIIYVAPERLLTESFIEVARELDISMITIDEAHCVSQWGQDFRPSYVQVAQFIEHLDKRPVVSAFTATATAFVRDDIVDKLQLQAPYVATTGFDRTNLHFIVKKPKHKLLELKEILSDKEEQCGIIYCSTRKAVEQVYDELVAAGYEVAKYHAGLSDGERLRYQEDFIYDRARIMVATNAFGMGIDKSDVSYVIHFNMPKNLENYYQEAGRAGRDGTPAECILLYGGQDVVTNQFLIDRANDNEELDSATLASVKAKDRELLKQMTFYCHTNDCLREYILRYFGDQASHYCGNCSNCNENFETVDIRVDAQKIISCIKRLHERFGIKMIVDTLRGKNTARIRQLELDQQSTYGIMADVSENRVRAIINYLILQEYIETTNSDYPVVRLLAKASEIIFDEEPLMMKVVKVEKKPVVKKQLSKKGEEINKEEHHLLFTRLKKLRSQLAQEQHVPAFVVFSDATLYDMCAKRPSTQMEFLEVSGVGHMKLEKYGELFLQEIEVYCRDEKSGF